MPRRKCDVLLSLPVAPEERAKVEADAISEGLGLYAYMRERLGLDPREDAHPPKAEEEMTPGALRVKRWRAAKRKAQ